MLTGTQRRWVAPFVLLALTIGVFWKILLTDQYVFFDSPDLAYQVAPWLQVQASEWHKNHSLLWWDPYMFGGQSLIGQAQPGVANPLNWLLFSMPLAKGMIQLKALHWYIALIHYIAALCFYALCRDLGRARAASILAASAFAFAGYIGTTGWPQMLNGAIWAPLLFLFCLRAFRGQAPLLNTLTGAAILGLMWLSGHHQIPIFVTLVISSVWLFQIVRNQSRRERLRWTGLFAAFLIMALAAGALQILPAYSYGQDAVRFVG